MDADAHAGNVAHDSIGHLHVKVDDLAPVIAARGQHRLHFRVAEFGKRRLVHLHISAASCRKLQQLGAKRLHHIVPELIDV